MPRMYRCFNSLCGWRGTDPDWRDWNPESGEVLCPLCDSEVGESLTAEQWHALWQGQTPIDAETPIN